MDYMTASRIHDATGGVPGALQRLLLGPEARAVQMQQQMLMMQQQRQAAAQAQQTQMVGAMLQYTQGQQQVATARAEKERDREFAREMQVMNFDNQLKLLELQLKFKSRGRGGRGGGRSAAAAQAGQPGAPSAFDLAQTALNGSSTPAEAINNLGLDMQSVIQSAPSEQQALVRQRYAEAQQMITAGQDSGALGSSTIEPLTFQDYNNASVLRDYESRKKELGPGAPEFLAYPKPKINWRSLYSQGGRLKQGG